MSDKPSNVLDNGKLVLTAPKHPNGDYPPKLKVQTYNNNPQFAVFSGVPSAKRGGVISAGMDPKTFFTVLSLIERMADEPIPESTVTYEIENHAGRGSEKALKSTTVIGKDPEGIVFLSVLDVDDSMPKIRFDFNADFYHKISIKGITKGEISCISAKGWVSMWRSLLGPHMVQSYEKVVFGGGKGGGYNNNRGNNNSGGGESSGGSNPW